MSTTFPDDHPIEVLRGRSMPEASEVRREIAVRIAWLKHRLELQLIDGQLPGRELRELKAMVLVRAMYDQAYPPESASDTEPPPAGSAAP